MTAKLSPDTLKLLEDVENRIDPQTEDDFRSQWRDFLFDRFDGDIFTPVRKKCTPQSASPFPNIF